MSENDTWAIQDTWLLEPPTRSTFPIREQTFPVKTSNFRKRTIDVLLNHPETPSHHLTENDLVICASGWTETRLEKQARAIGRVGLHSASFNHPRRGAIKDFWSLLKASKKLRANWRHLSEAIWDEQDLEHAEHILIDMISDQISDKHDQKTLLNSVISAGKSRRDNLLSVIESLREEGFNIHLLGHSLGGFDTTMATKAAPEYVESLTLAGPGGLMTNDTLAGIIPRVAGTVIGEREEFVRNSRELARMAVNTVLFIAENPILTIYEGGFAATGRLERTLWDTMADHSIPTTLVLGGKDRMFPTEVVTTDTRAIPFAGKIVIPEAGHNMTLHQTRQMACILGNIAIDLHNKRSSRLEANMKNLLYTRRHQRPTDDITSLEIEEQLFVRND